MNALSIFPATSEQILESRRRTWPEWGRGLTLEEYVAREEMLDTQPHATDGKMVIWVLAPRTDPTTLEFYTACETYYRESVTSQGPCVAYGIASVFTPERYREKGYAKQLMRLLHFVLIKPELLPPFPKETWGEPPIVPERLDKYRKGIASALYSDVGATFYRLCGPVVPGKYQENAWITHDAVGTTWPVNPSDSSSVSSEIQSIENLPSGFEWVSRDEQDAIWNQDSALLKEELTATPNTPGSDLHTTSTPTIFSFLPSGGVARFIYTRIKNFVPQDWKWKDDRWGVKTIQNGKLYFATWALDPGRPGLSTLIITRLRADENTFPIFLDCAKQVARELNLEQVEIWNLPDKLEDGGKRLGLGGNTGPREDHLPALAWFGDGDVHWVTNEKFCWC